MASNRYSSRRGYLAATSAVVTGALAGCSGALEGGTTNVEATFASALEAGTLENIAIKKFKQKIEDESDGSFTVNHVPGGSYGGEAEMSQTLSEGGIEGMGAGPLPIAMWTPSYWFHSSPYVMKDFEHLLRVDDSDLLQNGYDTIRNDHSVRVLGQPIYVGWRNATSNKPLRTVDDIQGLKIRDPPIDSWIRTWEGIGANPVSTPSDEIYSALETGVAAASGADANGAMSTNLYEVQSHFNIVKYLVGNRSLWVNEDFYSGLDETYQDMVTQFSQEASEEASQQGMDKEQEIIGNLKENGMTIVDDVEIETIREAARPTLESLFENNWEGTLEQVRNI